MSVFRVAYKLIKSMPNIGKKVKPDTQGHTIFVEAENLEEAKKIAKVKIKNSKQYEYFNERQLGTSGEGMTRKPSIRIQDISESKVKSLTDKPLGSGGK